MATSVRTGGVILPGTPLTNVPEKVQEIETVFETSISKILDNIIDNNDKVIENLKTSLDKYDDGKFDEIIEYNEELEQILINENERIEDNISNLLDSKPFKNIIPKDEEEARRIINKVIVKVNYSLDKINIIIGNFNKLSDPEKARIDGLTNGFINSTNNILNLIRRYSNEIYDNLGNTDNTNFKEKTQESINKINLIIREVNRINSLIPSDNDKKIIESVSKYRKLYDNFKNDINIYKIKLEKYIKLGDGYNTLIDEYIQNIENLKTINVSIDLIKSTFKDSDKDVLKTQDSIDGFNNEFKNLYEPFIEGVKDSINEFEKNNKTINNIIDKLKKIKIDDKEWKPIKENINKIIDKFDDDVKKIVPIIPQIVQQPQQPRQPQVGPVVQRGARVAAPGARVAAPGAVAATKDQVITAVNTLNTERGKFKSINITNRKMAGLFTSIETQIGNLYDTLNNINTANDNDLKNNILPMVPISLKQLENDKNNFLNATYPAGATKTTKIQIQKEKKDNTNSINDIYSVAKNAAGKFISYVSTL